MRMCSIILGESDEEEEKESTSKMDFHILKFGKKESEFNWRSSSRTWLWDFLQRVRDSDLHKYYEI